MGEKPTPAEVLSQSEILIKDYIYNRLKRSNLLTMKAELKGEGATYSDVSQQIIKIGTELEKMHPHLYKSVSLQLNMPLASENIVKKTVASLADQLFKQSITWAKIVALFSLAGAIACDVVQQDHSQFVSTLVDSFQDAVKVHLRSWIIEQGGWVSHMKISSHHTIDIIQ